METELPSPKRGQPKKGAEPPTFGPCLLLPNGCMDQDATWHGGRPRPNRHCARWRLSSPPQKRVQSLAHVYCGQTAGHQDATWYGGRPRPRPRCTRPGPRLASIRSHLPPPPKKVGAQLPQFLAHVCCGQTAGWIKMPLGAKVCLSPGHPVLHGDPAYPCQRVAAPNFWQMFIVVKWSPISATAEHLYCIHCCSLSNDSENALFAE